MTSTKIPDLALTHGQALWAIAKGQEPSRQMVDVARYLRSLGIPFSKKELGTGRGNKLTYDFDHLIELAIAFSFLEYGMRKKDVKDYISLDRSDLRKKARIAFTALPPQAIEAEWVKSRGRIFPLMQGQVYLPYYDHVSKKQGKLEYPKEEVNEDGFSDIANLISHMDQVTVMPDGQTKPAIPLTRLVLETVAWALEAPVFKTGPASGKQKKA